MRFHRTGLSGSVTCLVGGDTPRYRRECNGPFGPQGRIVGARNCRQRLTQLPCHPLSDERLLRIQHSLRARLHRPRDGPIAPTKDFWDLYELLFRLAIYLGTPEMLPPALTSTCGGPSTSSATYATNSRSPPGPPPASAAAN
jgi:hypothetical protein